MEIRGFVIGKGRPHTQKLHVNCFIFLHYFSDQSFFKKYLLCKMFILGKLKVWGLPEKGGVGVKKKREKEKIVYKRKEWPLKDEGEDLGWRKYPASQRRWLKSETCMETNVRDAYRPQSKTPETGSSQTARTNITFCSVITGQQWPSCWAGKTCWSRPLGHRGGWAWPNRLIK